MFEEHVVAGTEGGQACVASVGPAEAVFRAFSVTKVDIFACDAFRWKGVAFVQSETALHIRRSYLAQMLGFDIAGEIFRIDEMVARIHITVMLHDEIASASGSIST